MNNTKISEQIILFIICYDLNFVGEFPAEEFAGASSAVYEEFHCIPNNRMKLLKL